MAATGSQSAWQTLIRMDYDLEKEFLQFQRKFVKTIHIQDSAVDWSAVEEESRLLRTQLERMDTELKRLIPGQNATIEHQQKWTEFQEQQRRRTVDLRKWLVQVKQVLDQRQEHRNRQQLFYGASASDASLQPQHQQQEKQARNITEALKRTNRKMMEEVARSAEALRVLRTCILLQLLGNDDSNKCVGESTDTIKKTEDEYQHGAGQQLRNAHRAITKLFQRDRTDRLLLALCALVFFATVLYILKVRLWG